MGIVIVMFLSVNLIVIAMVLQALSEVQKLLRVNNVEIRKLTDYLFYLREIKED